MKAFFQAAGLAVAVSLSAMAMADTASGTGTNPERVFAFNGAMPIRFQQLCCETPL